MLFILEERGQNSISVQQLFIYLFIVVFVIHLFAFTLRTHFVEKGGGKRGRGRGGFQFYCLCFCGELAATFESDASGCATDCRWGMSQLLWQLNKANVNKFNYFYNLLTSLTAPQTHRAKAKVSKEKQSTFLQVFLVNSHSSNISL